MSKTPYDIWILEQIDQNTELITPLENYTVVNARDDTDNNYQQQKQCLSKTCNPKVIWEETTSPECSLRGRCRILPMRYITLFTSHNICLLPNGDLGTHLTHSCWSQPDPPRNTNGNSTELDIFFRIHGRYQRTDRPTDRQNGHGTRPVRTGRWRYVCATRPQNEPH